MSKGATQPNLYQAGCRDSVTSVLSTLRATYEMSTVPGTKACVQVRSNITNDITVEVIESSLDARYEYIGDALLWDDVNTFDGKNRDHCSCHCPWGEKNWHTVCDNLGMSCGSDKGGTGNLISNCSLCYQTQGRTKSTGCFWGGYETDFEARHQLNLVPRAIFRKIGETEFTLKLKSCAYTFNAPPTYDAKCNLAYTATISESFGDALLLNDFVSTVYTRVRNVIKDDDTSPKSKYIMFNNNEIIDANGNLLIKNLIEVPEEYVSLEGSDTSKIGFFMRQVDNSVVYKSAEMIAIQTDRTGIDKCHESSCSSSLDHASVNYVEDEPTFLMKTQRLVLNSSFYDIMDGAVVLNIRTKPVVEISLQATGGLGGVQPTSTVPFNDYNDIAPVISEIVCPNYNKLIGTIECNITFLVTGRPTVYDIVVGTGNLKIDTIMGQIGVNTVPFEMNPSIIHNGQTSLCLSEEGTFTPAVYGQLDPTVLVCSVIKAKEIEVNDEPVIDPKAEDDDGEEEEQKAEEGATTKDGGAKLPWWLIFIICIVALILVVIIILLIYRYLGPGIKKHIEAVRKNMRKNKLRKQKYRKQEDLELQDLEKELSLEDKYGIGTDKKTILTNTDTY